MTQTNYAKGIYFNKKNEKAPSFVLGSLSVKKEAFMEWLDENTADEKGYIRLKINESKDGKPYIAIDDWKPEKKENNNWD